MTMISISKSASVGLLAMGLIYHSVALADGEASVDYTPVGTYCGINAPLACITFGTDRSVSLNFGIGNNQASAPLQVSSGLRGPANGTQFTFLVYVDFPQGFPDHGTYCRYSTRATIDVQSDTEIDMTLTAPSQIALVNGACTFTGSITLIDGLRK